MSSISAVGSASSAWPDPGVRRAAMKERMFAKIDTNGSGGVDKSALSAAVSGPPPGRPAEGAPPAGGAAAGASGASGNSGTTTYDPLDTNEDGVVSAPERMAREVQELMNAMDTSGDQSVSASEVDSFISPLVAASTTPSSSSVSDSGSNAGDHASKASRHGGGQGAANGNAPGELVREAFARTAANCASTATVDVAA